MKYSEDIRMQENKSKKLGNRVECKEGVQKRKQARKVNQKVKLA